MGLESVADAGPLIHLSEISALSAFKIFSAIHVPDAVQAEVKPQEHIDTQTLLSQSNLQFHLLDRQEIDTFIQAQDLASLHRGEQAALFLCHNQQIPVLLTDDLAARQTAQRLGLIPVGSLGIIIRAFRENLFPQDVAADHLRKLHSVSSLFVTSEIVELAIEQLQAPYS
jgi:predicted nucleic acid-binding protein